MSITLNEAKENIGRRVVYRTEYNRSEQGQITSVNGRFVFVRYGSSFGSQATNPCDLAWLSE